MRNSVKRSALAVLVVMLASVSMAYSTELTLAPQGALSFVDMAEGQSIDTLTAPWTGSGAPSIVASMPAGTESPITVALTATGTERIGALSPQQDLPASFSQASAGETLYFSAWLLKNGGGGSVVFNSNAAPAGYTFTLGGFGIAEGATGFFTYLTDANGDGIPESVNSAKVAERNTWYEVVLVIQQDIANYADSLGYLYYRKASDPEFTLLPEFENGLKMSWWSPSFSARDFAFYRIDSARNNFQIANFSVGTVSRK